MTGDERDHRWLRRALDLARQCPPTDTAFSVGAVIVSNDDIEISNGYSRETDPTVHAEESALIKAVTDPRLRTATLYSTLEPCGERKSRPQTCADLIIQSGIRRVVYAWREPNDYVDTPSGHRQLLEARIDVLELPSLGAPFLRTHKT